MKVVCEFCGKDKKVKVRSRNRLICQPCWNERVEQCQVEANDGRRCRGSTIDSDHLCDKHKDRTAYNWRPCTNCRWGETREGGQCYRCQWREESGLKPERPAFLPPDVTVRIGVYSGVELWRSDDGARVYGIVSAGLHEIRLAMISEMDRALKEAGLKQI